MEEDVARHDLGDNEMDEDSNAKMDEEGDSIDNMGDNLSNSKVDHCDDRIRADSNCAYDHDDGINIRTDDNDRDSTDDEDNNVCTNSSSSNNNSEYNGSTPPLLSMQLDSEMNVDCNSSVGKRMRRDDMYDIDITSPREILYNTADNYLDTYAVEEISEKNSHNEGNNDVRDDEEDEEELYNELEGFKADPLRWLRDNWFLLVVTVRFFFSFCNGVFTRKKEHMLFSI